tara:strand:- start:477 stop:599 length:123 start_codon:yes stop_codon:yes gene_type:complete
MNITTIVIISIFLTLTLYIAFLLAGLGGIDKNRKAQGLDK